jgi:hypothetical protein
MKDSIIDELKISGKYKEVLTFVGRFTPLLFTAIGAPLAARRIRILPMNQYACCPITFGMKYLTIHRSQKVLKMLRLYT